MPPHTVKIPSPLELPNFVTEISRPPGASTGVAARKSRWRREPFALASQTMPLSPGPEAATYASWDAREHPLADRASGAPSSTAQSTVAANSEPQTIRSTGFPDNITIHPLNVDCTSQAYPRAKG
jgi:hypothetical protein